ncbi:hypothetical protein GPECTOR_28g828 [Gonium pectorale]|uniref:Uncharacterized protein n=1 Tax=Gonium pectorale TaxID=33097 RepID=A0A150GGE9_GONPE|nr:hypothetical protein GPECTOR_28g828 [Gonium pectorale]|eukprot:KXZ48420.1 hypothetical protein GPECTOR_28g828 [Gonium pectorale]
MTMARGPEVTLPPRLELLGIGHVAGEEGGGCASACPCGDQQNAPPPADAYAGSGVNPSTVLDLSSLSGVFVVPTNGNVALRGLELWGVALPTSPIPLSPAAFLALSAFKLPPASVGNSSAGNHTEATAGGSCGGLPLQLSNLLISTPSCVALSLHQHFACRFSPSPNFTVTPTSLTIHRLTTPTADIVNVKLVCTGKPAPVSCLAAAAATGPQLLASLRTLQTQAQLAAAAAPNSAPPTVLDLTGTGGLFSIGVFGGAASVELRDLTIRNPPLGPQDQYPWSLLRSFLWTFGYWRRLLGAQKTMLRGVRLTVELQPDELAFWLAEGPGGRAAVPRELWPSFCAERGGGTFFSAKDMLTWC